MSITDKVQAGVRELEFWLIIVAAAGVNGDRYADGSDVNRAHRVSAAVDAFIFLAVRVG